MNLNSVEAEKVLCRCTVMWKLHGEIFTDISQQRAVEPYVRAKMINFIAMMDCAAHLRIKLNLTEV